MRRLLIAGNWKMNMKLDSAKALAQGLKDAASGVSEVDIAVCPPSIYVQPVCEILKGSNIGVGAQNAYFEKAGAFTGELEIVREIAYSDGDRAKVRCFGADDVREGVAIMHHEGADVSITGNSTNPTRFQHPVAGTYKKECVEQGKKYFSVASGGGTGRTLHPDNMAAGPASYGMTDTMGRMHSDAQFAGSSSVPAHVEMMGFMGMGNNPMVGATVACAVAVASVM